VIDRFIEDGFVRIDDAFPRDVADAARALLWRETGCDPDRPATWTRPVIRLGHYDDAPFAAAASAPVLREACDRLVGPNRWLPRHGLGTFPIRFPSADDPGDAGWHVDVSFGVDDPDFLNWRANVRSKGRALLLLFLFSDVGDDDAPTRIRVGSHHAIARQLAPAGEAGLSLRDLAADGFASSADCREVLATGEAGTVYACHPFLVHAAQPHRGTRPRFMAQPPLLPVDPTGLDIATGTAPVEEAIRRALRGVPPTPDDGRRRRGSSRR
jgi:hypothetical protein